ncbi:MAG TPA: YtxH domain-containing protein [Acidimicrobiales bacterium]|nr:YtxH domain-containing protein [Acidimicrobiales bacterium]
MKFKTGIALGFAAGYWAATQASEQTRAQVDEFVGRVRENPRVQRVTETVTRDARKLGDAVEQRVRSVTDKATDEVAGKARPSGGSSGNDSGTRTARTA